MLAYALIVFVIAASGGLTLAVGWALQGKLAPWGLSLLHVAFGALGLALLILAALTARISGGALAALVILLIAALVGFYLASIHLRGEVAPHGVVFVHAGVAGIGFLVLLGAVIGLM